MNTPLFVLRDIDYGGRLETRLRDWSQRGFSVREVAQFLDVSPATAHRWMSQASGKK